MTGAEMLTREVREKALVQGRMDVVLRQLTRKFGPLSEPHIRRIQQADADTLDRWADRLLTADRIDEVFAD